MEAERAGVGTAVIFGEGTMTTTHVEVAGHIIKRPRLTRILDETEARIILLCAPAGYGKTTLAREWVATRSEPVYWYSAGPAAADVEAFSVDLTEVLGSDSEATDRVGYLVAGGSTPRVLGEAVARVANPAALIVIDDYHQAASAECDAFFRELILNTSARFLVTTRVRPPWADARSV